MKKKKIKFQFLLILDIPDIIDMNMHRCYYYSLLYYLPIFVLLRDNMMNQNTETINYVLLLHELSNARLVVKKSSFSAALSKVIKTKVWRLLCLILSDQA